jgi:hypothetical protein
MIGYPARAAPPGAVHGVTERMTDELEQPQARANDQPGIIRSRQGPRGGRTAKLDAVNDTLTTR